LIGLFEKFTYTEIGPVPIDNIGGEMVNVLASSVVHLEFKDWV
jgi:hypothetical protein